MRVRTQEVRKRVVDGAKFWVRGRVLEGASLFVDSAASAAVEVL